jgi:hypothetical protein
MVQVIDLPLIQNRKLTPHSRFLLFLALQHIPESHSSSSQHHRSSLHLHFHHSWIPSLPQFSHKPVNATP